MPLLIMHVILTAPIYSKVHCSNNFPSLVHHAFPSLVNYIKHSFCKMSLLKKWFITPYTPITITLFFLSSFAAKLLKLCTLIIFFSPPIHYNHFPNSPVTFALLSQKSILSPYFIGFISSIWHSWYPSLFSNSLFTWLLRKHQLSLPHWLLFLSPCDD